MHPPPLHAALGGRGRCGEGRFGPRRGVAGLHLLGPVEERGAMRLEFVQRDGVPARLPPADEYGDEREGEDVGEDA